MNFEGSLFITKSSTSCQTGENSQPKSPFEVLIGNCAWSRPMARIFMRELSDPRAGRVQNPTIPSSAALYLVTKQT